MDVGKSVSRVGGKAQREAYRVVTGDLKLAYAQFEELETFSRFGARLDEETRKGIEHGRRIRACLKQPEFSPMSLPEQIAVLLTLSAGLFDSVPMDQMAEAKRTVQKAAEDFPSELCARFGAAAKLGEEDRQTVINTVRAALARARPRRNPAPADVVTSGEKA